ncbi:MAG: glycosyltransferase family 2 protein [Fibrobacteres bacterium]|nr:glycosyltransferase family 2 protein [Fibrobacterota bacterium]
MKIGIFIPSYNAGKFLERVIDRVPESIKDNIHKIWIINDGSTDDTGIIAAKLAASNDNINVLTFQKNRGYGAVVKAGLGAAKETGLDYIICLHGDGQYPPESMPDMLHKAAAGGYDIIQGSRHLNKGAAEGGMPLYKIIGGKILVFLENLVFGLSQTDYHSGYLCYSKKVIEKVKFENLSPSFDIDLEIIASARASALSISEIAISTRYADEVSYLNPFTYGLRVLRVLYKYISGHYRRRCVNNDF